MLDQQALSDSAFLHAWNEVRHQDLEENKFLDRQVQLRHVWALHIAARDALRQQALAERQARLLMPGQKLSKASSLKQNRKQPTKRLSRPLKLNFIRTSIVLTNEMIDLLVAGQRDLQGVALAVLVRIKAPVS